MGDVFTLADELEQGRRIPQPRLRHRLQRDRVGLTRSVQRLHRRGGRVVSRLDGLRARPGQLVLGAVYAAGSLPSADRAEAMEAVRRGLAWGAASDLRPCRRRCRRSGSGRSVLRRSPVEAVRRHGRCRPVGLADGSRRRSGPGVLGIGSARLRRRRLPARPGRGPARLPRRPPGGPPRPRRSRNRCRGPHSRPERSPPNPVGLIA